MRRGYALAFYVVSGGAVGLGLNQEHELAMRLIVGAIREP